MNRQPYKAEKRRKEIARQKKQEEKRLKRQEKKKNKDGTGMEGEAPVATPEGQPEIQQNEDSEKIEGTTEGGLPQNQ
jgi:hypothetical protein